MNLAGGLGPAWERAQRHQLPGIQPRGLPAIGGVLPAAQFPGWMVLASLVLITSIGPWGMPQMVQKFYSLKSENDVTRAMIVATVFALIISFAAYFSGALTHLFYQAPARGPRDRQALGRLPDAPPAHGDVPSLASLVILLLVLSASMSSLSSLVLVSSSAVAIDLYARDANPKPTPVPDHSRLLRALCGVFVLASLAIALTKPVFILSLMVISWGAIGGSFLAPYVYGLFLPWANRAGAIAGMLSGLGTAWPCTSCGASRGCPWPGRRR